MPQSIIVDFEELVPFWSDDVCLLYDLARWQVIVFLNEVILELVQCFEVVCFPVSESLVNFFLVDFLDHSVVVL